MNALAISAWPSTTFTRPDGAHAEEVGQRLVVGAELLVHRVRERRAQAQPVRPGPREPVVARVRDGVVPAAPAQADQAVRIPDGDLLDQKPVDRAEDGGVRADAEGEGDQDDGGPPLRVQQDTDRVAKIVEHR
jgi:hypothetical protein